MQNKMQNTPKAKNITFFRQCLSSNIESDPDTKLYHYLLRNPELFKRKKLFPDVLSKYLGYYLLLSLGLKGGISLETTGFINDVVNVLSIGVFLAVLIPLIAYIYLRNVLNIEDASALAGTYGSVSAVTFVTAINFLSNSTQQFDDYMSAVLVVMEFPAIFMALFFC